MVYNFYQVFSKGLYIHVPKGFSIEILPACYNSR